jgi:hypothetical protein
LAASGSRANGSDWNEKEGGRGLILTSTFKESTKMKKLILALFALALMMSMTAFAQDTMKTDDKDTNMKADKMSTRAVSISGKVGEDGKTFVSDKDSKTFTVSNPDALKGHEGHQVIVKANVDSDKDEIQVTSVKMAKSQVSDKDQKKY